MSSNYLRIKLEGWNIAITKMKKLQRPDRYTIYLKSSTFQIEHGSRNVNLQNLEICEILFGKCIFQTNLYSCTQKIWI